MGGHTFKRKAPFATTSFKKGGEWAYFRGWAYFWEITVVCEVMVCVYEQMRSGMSSVSETSGAPTTTHTVRTYNINTKITAQNGVYVTHVVR